MFFHPSQLREKGRRTDVVMSFDVIRDACKHIRPYEAMLGRVRFCCRGETSELVEVWRRWSGGCVEIHLFMYIFGGNHKIAGECQVVAVYEFCQ